MYTLKKGDIVISIATSPLEIRSIKYKGQELCYQQDGAWKKNWPFLFPIVGLLRDNTYRYQGQEYHMNRHGFFRDITSWVVEDELDGLVTFSAVSNGQFANIYPFEFKIKNQIEIVDNQVIVSYEVINLDDKEMIFAMGHHPAFLCQKTGTLTYTNAEKWTQKVNDKGLVAQNQPCEVSFQSGTIRDLDFADSKFYYNEHLQSSAVTYSDDKISYTIDLADYDVMLMWSASNEENFICLEPWLSVPDYADRTSYELEQKPKMLTLDPNESATCELKITFNEVK